MEMPNPFTSSVSHYIVSFSRPSLLMVSLTIWKINWQHTPSIIRPGESNWYCSWRERRQVRDIKCIICVYLICNHEWNLSSSSLSLLLLFVAMCIFISLEATKTNTLRRTTFFPHNQRLAGAQPHICICFFVLGVCCLRARAIWESGPMACDEKQKERKSFSLSAVHSHSAPHTIFSHTFIFYFFAALLQRGCLSVLREHQTILRPAEEPQKLMARCRL
jgi:hypothetical protein